MRSPQPMRVRRPAGAGRALRLAQRGVTLVELMIAMMLGLILTAGVIQIFIGNRTTYAFSEGLSWVQENGRWALDHIANNVRMVGNLGCLTGVPVTNHLTAVNTLRDDLVNALQGFEANGSNPGSTYNITATNPGGAGNLTLWTPALPADLDNLVVRGSDVIAVRYVGGGPRPLTTPFTSSTTVTLAAGNGYQDGQILVVTDCQKASIFQLTGGGNTAALTHVSGGGRVPGNAAANAVWPANESYGLGSEIATLETVVFYVGPGANDSAGGNGVPSLHALRLTRIDANTSRLEPFELIEGVDSMQVRYGVDTDNNRQVDAWQSANTVAAANNWPRVLSVEIALLMRSSEEYGTTIDTATYNVGGTIVNPVNDRRLRQVFSTTVGLRNRLP